MNTITITTSTLITTREAIIDGVDFTVRKMGAGDQLDISQASAKLMNANQDLLNIKAKMQSATDEVQVAKYAKDCAKMLDAVVEINRALEEVYSRLFDDHGDQSKSKALIHNIGVDGATKILAQIFEEA